MGRGILTGLAVLTLALVAGSLALSSVTQDVLDADYNGAVIYDQRYGEAERNLYDLYLPEDCTADRAQHLILFIHGGAWTSGDKADGAAWCSNLAAHGYVAASMSYTLRTPEKDPDILLINSEVTEAVRAIKARCAEADIGISLKDMAVHGFSAGACQAMLFGFRERENSLTDPGLLPIRFILQQSGPSTFEPAIWRERGETLNIIQSVTLLDGTASGDAAFISLFTGQPISAKMVMDGSAEPYWKVISPYTYIDENSVPVLFAYGAYDGIVPPKSRIVLEEALKKAGKVEGTDYVEFFMENSGHGLNLDPLKQAQFLEEVYRFCDRYFVD